MNQERINFDKKFDTQEKEVFVLTMEACTSFQGGQDTLWQAHQCLIAYVDAESGSLQESGSLYTQKTFLTWLMTEEERQSDEQIFNLQPQTIYKLKVRESFPFNQLPRAHNLLVVDVLERDCHHPALEQALAEYQKPIVLSLESYGTLTLDKRFNSFCGNVCVNGSEFEVILDTDTGSDTAHIAAKAACSLLSKWKDWDKKAKEYAAEQLAEDAEEWLFDEETLENTAPDELSEKAAAEFTRRIQICSITIDAEGFFELYYDDDGIFGYHSIVVNGDLEDGLEDVYCAG